MRVDRFLAEELPEFEPDDARCISISIARPTPRIPSTISRSSARPTWSSCGVAAQRRRTAGDASEAGEITLQQMLHEWSMHDLGHVRQVAELVRARKHWEQAGRLGESYQLRP